MALHPWLTEEWTPCAAEELTAPRATRFAAFLAAHGSEIARNIKVHKRGDGAALVQFDLAVDCPQRPPVDIRRTEPVGVIFPAREAAPVLMALRADFPDTEHQNLVPDGVACALCIDNRPWEEAQLSWSPAELLYRIALWFKRAARGELHDAHQAVEPFFGGSAVQIVLPRRALVGAAGALVELHGFLPAASNGNVVVTRESAEARAGEVQASFSFVAYRIAPERMRRLRSYPVTLKALAEFLAGRGIDLCGDLKERIKAWHGIGKHDAARLGTHLGVILDLPVIGADGSGHAGSQLIALISCATVGEIGVALGVFEPNTSEIGARDGYVVSLSNRIPQDADLAAIGLAMAHVHPEFDAERAAALSGAEGSTRTKAVLIGGGAIGSHVAEMLAREGRVTWTAVIDDDVLFPHNLARHTLTSADVGRLKAPALAARLGAIQGGGAKVGAVAANILRPAENEAAMAAALSDAGLTVDATASVAAARTICDMAGVGRRLSMYFNPAGDGCVLLCEPPNRHVTLRDLEAQYYGAVLRRPELAAHLTGAADRMPYAAACRAVTSRIAESRVAALSGLVAEGCGKALSSDAGTIRVWTVAGDGTVIVSAPVVRAVARYTLLDWTVTVDDGVRDDMVRMRRERLPCETGGILLGVVDMAARRIHVIDAWSAPEDSEESGRCFERGIRDLSDRVQRAMDRTSGQVRYIGEWHSHPRRVSTAPSTTDLRQMFWLSGSLSLDDCPAVMVIVGDEGLRIVLGDCGSPTGD